MGLESKGRPSRHAMRAAFRVRVSAAIVRRHPTASGFASPMPGGCQAGMAATEIDGREDPLRSP